MSNTNSVCDKDHTCNGWTNYETWSVALYMDNDQGSQNHWSDMAREILQRPSASKHWTLEESHKFELADAIKKQHESDAEQAIDASPGVPPVFLQLLNGALSEVDWDAIAEHLLEGVKA